MLPLQIVSDLHLEFHKQKDKLIKPLSPFLCLLGDISPCGSKKDYNEFYEWIKLIKENYRHIFHVPGNHEYYCFTDATTFDRVNARLRAIEKVIKNYHVMVDRSIILRYKNKRYKIIGTTLWSIPQDNVRSMINDYSKIYVRNRDKKVSGGAPMKNIQPTDVRRMCKCSTKFIECELKKARIGKMKCVLLTHHKPLITTRKKSGDPVLNSAYETDLSQLLFNPLFSDTLALIAYGHTHQASKLKKGKTVIYSNPYGYPYERSGYKDYVILV